MRAMAARAVGELALPELVPDLRALTADDDPATREAAHDALVQLGEEKPMETLQTISSLERVLLLREVPLFEALTPEDLKQIADVAREELHHDGAEVVREGDPGDAMFVIVDGQVRVVKGAAGDEELLATRGAGDFIGEMAIIEAQPRFATIRADGDVRVLVIDAKAFDAILRDRPQVARALLRGLSRRLREGH
jgi:HEAT repeat protein